MEGVVCGSGRVSGADVPFGNLGPNRCPGGDMETGTADGMALGWEYWGTRPDAKVLEKDAQARQGQRVADPQQVTLHVDAQDWQQFSLVWFAESLDAANANLFMNVNPHTELDLDGVAFQRMDPNAGLTNACTVRQLTIRVAGVER